MTQKIMLNSSSVVLASDHPIIKTYLGAVPYTATTINLTSGQAAGESPIILANSARKALQFRASANFELALAPSQTYGMRIHASARDSLVGAECPIGDLFLVSGSGLNTNDPLTFWEA